MEYQADSPPLLASEPMVPRPFRVRRVERELAGIRTLHLDPGDGGESLSFTPGQFNMLYVFGVGEAAISIAGRSVRNKSLLHTVRAVGTVTGAICDLRQGATVGLRGPFGTGWPLAAAAGKDVLLIAGGVGLPPIWSVLQEILAHRRDFGSVALLLGARTPANILYRRQLKHLQDRPDFFLGVTVDHAGPEWHSHVGVVTTLIDQTPFSATNSVAMICGPEVMMRFTVRELQRRGMQEDQIYLSMERNMKCAIAVCGHCQFGPAFVCREGPVFRYDKIRDWLAIREL